MIDVVPIYGITMLGAVLFYAIHKLCAVLKEELE